MKKLILITVIVCISCIFAFYSCQKPLSMPNSKPNVSASYVYTDKSISSPASNPLTNEGAALGRVLFYDKTLSINNNVSCGSCHLQSHSFADATALSTGFGGGRTRRNSLSIVNESHKQEYFWDSRETALEKMVLDPIKHKVEMGFVTISELPYKLQKVSYYPDLFTKAYGTPDITYDRISMALSQFVRSMQSNNSKFDIGFSNNFANYTAQEKLGMNLFVTKFQCNNCHTMIDPMKFGMNIIIPDTLNNPGGYSQSLIDANIGLDSVYTDNGVGEITGSAFQNGLFRIPTLKNIGYTAPYMHDGRFNTLDEVIEHYNSGIQNHPNLNSFLISNMTGKPIRFNMTADQKAALKAFLLTLDDQTFVSDPKFSNPFSGQ